MRTRPVDASGDMPIDQLLAWVRTQPGTRHLRALLVFDEVYGFAPPHPKDPPTKKPLISLMKQARAYGLGVVLATQNPMDVDYRVLSNAGFWCLGRLSTDADRRRVVEAMTHTALAQRADDQGGFEEAGVGGRGVGYGEKSAAISSRSG